MLKKYSAMPYLLWSGIFILVPLFLIMGYAFTEVSVDGNFQISFDHFSMFLKPMYLKVLMRSLLLAFEATVICLILGYPMAMILSSMPTKIQKISVLLFILPMWMNFLLKTYAWVNLLGRNGMINKIVMFLGFEPINFLFNRGAVLLGMVYNFFPFMVLPIYTVLIKIDPSVVEAAKDLGAGRFMVFRKIILPLSLSGVLTGITMVFMPAASTFVISALLGGGQFMLVGNLIEQQFLWVNNRHFGSAISLVLMALILLSMLILDRFDNGDEGGVL